LASYFSKTKEPPENYYLALIRQIAPTPFVSGAELDEPDGMGYARLRIPNNSVYWSNESQPQVMLMVENLSFQMATDNWGMIRYWALCNAEAEGFVYATGSLETVQDVPEGEVVQLLGSDLAISIGPFYAEEN